LVLHGLTGPIEVKGEKYAGLVPMTAVGAMFSDAEVAAVLTFVRNSWGNESDPISIADVKAVRAATKGRKLPYTPEILLKEHPLPKQDK
ncbi:MAG: c-type cytochrome, partial [Verrucomicrobiales bacterium]